MRCLRNIWAYWKLFSCQIAFAAGASAWVSSESGNILLLKCINSWSIVNEWHVMKLSPEWYYLLLRTILFNKGHLMWIRTLDVNKDIIVWIRTLNVMKWKSFKAELECKTQVMMKSCSWSHCLLLGYKVEYNLIISWVEAELGNIYNVFSTHSMLNLTVE